MSIPHYKECIRAGLKLIPLVGKRPVWKEWQHETDKNRITDPDDGRLWQFDAFGWQIPKGYCVVDVDQPKKFKYQLMEGHTASQITQSGGSHYLCKLPENTPVEYSHEWGEILMHPRQIKIYQLSDDWLRGEIEELPKAFWGNSITNGSSSGSRLSVPRDLETLPEVGDRNNWLTAKAGELWNQKGVHAIKVIYELAAELGLDEKEADGIVGQLPKWERTENDDFVPGAEEPPINDFVRADLLAEMDIRPVEFWQKPYGPGQAVIIYGYTGHGKSIVMMNHMFELAESGRQVVIVDGELTLTLIKRRIGRSPTENLWFMKPEDMQQWYECDFAQFDVIVLDTKSALYTDKEPNENASNHWTALHKFVLHWMAKGKCVVLVHHSGKSSDLRGSSNAAAPFDTTLHVVKEFDKDGDPKGTYTLAYVKDRHCISESKWRFVIDEGVNGRLVIMGSEA